MEPLDGDIGGLILEFVFRSTSDESLQKQLLYLLPVSNSPVRLGLSRIIALRSIEYEIKDASVTEKILENLEIAEESDRLQGIKILDSMKKAYCLVGVECTAKYLVSSSSRKGKYFESVKRIWRGRIRNLEKSRISELLTDELIKSWKEIEAAVEDEDACNRLMDRNTRNAALCSVGAYLEEALASMGPTILELGSRLMRTVRYGHLHERSERAGDERTVEGIDKEETRSPVVAQALEALKDSMLESRKVVKDLAEALRVADALVSEMAKQNASVVVDAEEVNVESGRVKEVVNVMPSSSHPETSKRGLMERNNTAQTYEWDDFTDDDDSSEGRPKRIRLSTPKKIVVSPLRKQKITKVGTRRMIKRWSLEEEEALRDGVNKYGKGKWKMILDANPNGFDERTECDLKDKWRNLTR